LVVRLSETLAADELAAADRAGVFDDEAQVRAAIGALPDDLAELVRLVYWDGFSIEQAASHLGVPASTLRGRHARAKRALRDALDISEQTAPATRSV
jgi:RNA polymerase sigma-70 factor (ECF subfamily)